jgi:hypothetical protein
MNSRFQDTAAAYRLHRAVTNEAEAISGAVYEYAADDLRLTRNFLRVLDAGTGDGQVLKGVAEHLLQNHRWQPCAMLLKEYDFQHIETLLQNIASLLRQTPRLSLFITNRPFRQLKDFPGDLCAENTVCFDDIAGYRLLAMDSAAALLNQDDALRFSFPPADERRGAESAQIFLAPLMGLWNGELRLSAGDSLATPALKALGDEIRAREVYDELAAAGGRGKHFTVTVARHDGGMSASGGIGEFFWDLAIVSHAFNRDKDPSWVCRNILIPLCEGLAAGGVLVNVHAIDGGQASEIRRAIFGEEFSFQAPPPGLAAALGAALDTEQFQLLPRRHISYQCQITGELFSSLEPWQRELTLRHLAISVAYHLQIPEAAWTLRGDAIAAKIQQVLERDGRLEYALSISGVRRRA